MSWSAFEELKSYASSIYGSKNKRKKEWNTPTTKRQRNSHQPSNVEEGSIDGFSSEEEKDKTCRSFSSSKEQCKNDHHHRKAKRKRTTSASETRKDLENVIIDNIEDTPDDDKQERVLPSTSGQTVKTDQLPHGYHELEEVLDAMIKDFNSSDEEETVKDSEVHNIETLTPTPSSTLTPPRTTLPEKTPKTGSEWLKQVQHNMSSPNQDMPTSPDVKFDSAKKKQKFKRSGLAEQLQRIVNREKSEKSFWTHKQTAMKNELKGAADSTTALDVQVLSLHKQYSLHVTRCCVLSNKQESTAPYILDVVFNTPTMKQLALRVGCAVRIHPPWQKLHISSSPYPILLCTYYCEMLPTSPGPPPVDVTSLPDLNWPRTKNQGSSQLISSPKKSFQPSRLLFGDHETNEENSTHSESLTAVKTSQAKKTKKSLSIANVIEAQGGCSGECVSFEAVVQRVYRRRVKVAREKAFDSPGDVFLSKTIVTRARSAEDKEETRVVLLVQDWSKNLCEVQIPEEFTFFENWNSCIKMGIGKAYAFDDLRITQRTNRTRSPGLFNLMDSLWNSEEGDLGPEDKSSQIVSSDDSTSQPSTLTSPPNYCYVLTVRDTSKVTSLDDYRRQGSSFLYTPPCLTNLQQLSLHNDAPKRYAVWCRVICSRPNLHKSITRHISNPPSWTGQILVTDASLHRSFHCAPQESQDSSLPVRYVKLEVRASNVLSDSVQKAVCEAGTVLYIEDVAGSRKETQRLYADCYTTIKRGSTDPCQADIDKGDVQAIPISIYTELVGLRTREFLPSLSSNTTSESLCKVQGVVHGVDENSACCWLECTTCGCQDLMERSGLPYYCPLCKADVHKPQTKTNLDVTMKCDSWKEGHVVIKLLQATIEQLLPVSYQDSDQGYDIDCVLGKCLGPLYCYVNEHTGSTARLDEISVSV